MKRSLLLLITFLIIILSLFTLFICGCSGTTYRSIPYPTLPWLDQSLPAEQQMFTEIPVSVEPSDADPSIDPSVDPDGGLADSPDAENAPAGNAHVAATAEPPAAVTPANNNINQRPAAETPDRGAAAKPSPPSSSAKNGDLYRYVLSVMNTYQIGKYPYLLNTDYNNYNGVTTDLVYQGRTIAKANPNGNRASHCVGITFEVFFKAMQQRNRSLGLPEDNFNNMSADELRSFMLTWYVANGSKANSNVAVAVERFGLGKRITKLENAKAGDFIDFSRTNNTGHTAVFMGWIRENQKIIGLRYWSSQESTKGIAYKTEYFNVYDDNGVPYGNVDINNIYIARIK
jgi:hypothetical protein